VLIPEFLGAATLIPEPLGADAAGIFGAGAARLGLVGLFVGDAFFLTGAAILGIIAGIATPLDDPPRPLDDDAPSPLDSMNGALLSAVTALCSLPFLNPLMSVRSPCLAFGAFDAFGGVKSVGGGGGAGIDMSVRSL